MKHLKQLWVLAATAFLLNLSSGRIAAQGRGDFGGIDWQNMDPQQIQQQIQQRMLDRYREQLDVKNDDEWKIIEDRVKKVMQAQTDAGAGGLGGLAGLGRTFGNRGGGNAQGGGRAVRGLLGQTSPELDALQKALDANGSLDEIKNRLAAYLESRKQKEANLAKARDELRKVLSVRQEANAVLLGLL